MSTRLLELSRVEAGGRGRAGAICLLPVGSLEQHGEHLPVGTDTLLVETVAVRAAELAHGDVARRSHRVDRVEPAPCPARRHRDARARAPARARALGRRRPAGLVPEVVIVNGHGGNRGWLEALALVDGCPAVNYWELVDPALLRELFPPISARSATPARRRPRRCSPLCRPSSAPPEPRSSRSCAKAIRSASPTWARVACLATLPPPRPPPGSSSSTPPAAVWRSCSTPSTTPRR